jgi:transcriptional regulator with XRE-family HTH domain
MNKVRELRLSMNMSQRQLAQELGVCSEYISLIERERQTPGFKFANKIAKYFNVTVDYLNFFNRESNKTFLDKKIPEMEHKESSQILSKNA